MMNTYAERNGITEYVEPFLGAASVATHVTIPNKYLSEIQSDLVELWRSALAGTFNPKRINDDEYKLIARNEMQVTPEDRAFYATACSFGGKWFGGFARGQDFHQIGINSIERKRRLLEEHSDSITITNESYEQAVERHRGNPNTVFYFDPPYQGTTGYKGTPRFNNGRFWDVVRDISRDHVVFVSEYTYPDDFVPVQTFNSQITLDISNDKPTKREFLLVHESRVDEVLDLRAITLL